MLKSAEMKEATRLFSGGMLQWHQTYCPLVEVVAVAQAVVAVVVVAAAVAEVEVVVEAAAAAVVAVVCWLGAGRSQVHLDSDETW